MRSFLKTISIIWYLATVICFFCDTYYFRILCSIGIVIFITELLYQIVINIRQIRQNNGDALFAKGYLEAILGAFTEILKTRHTQGDIRYPLVGIVVITIILVWQYFGNLFVH